MYESFKFHRFTPEKIEMLKILNRESTCAYREPTSQKYISRINSTKTTATTTTRSESSSSSDVVVVVERFPVDFRGYQYEGHLAYPRGSKKNRPLILVFPNYAGEKGFDVDQAIFLAQMGYAAVSVDMYKDSEWYPRRIRNPTLEDPHEDIVKHWKGAFRAYNSWQKDPKGWRDIMTCYLVTARKHFAVHPVHAAAIGYCFGGQCVLEMVRNGNKLDGVVSFHGVLQSDPIKEPINLAKGIDRRELRAGEKASDENFNSNVSILIENGTLDDGCGPKEKARFWKEMDEKKASNVQFHDHIEAEHGFALAPGVISSKYNEFADRRSTISMLLLFVELWGSDYAPLVKPTTVNACGTDIGSYWPTRKSSRL